jgi:chemotaxis protein methyltransferase CheR
MPSPGYLCVGVSESLLRRTSTFELQEIGGAFVYVKGAPPATRQTYIRSVETTS